ncbi:MAG: DUF2807 domain-containing protein [Bacteroidales bacterium]|nr:DUF2807 domain-containing protein [Bacteroidales bacterium]
MGYVIAGDYTKLDVSSAFDVVVCDTVTQAMVTTPNRLQRYVVVRVEDGVLTIKLRPHLMFGSYDATVLLPRNEKLCELELSGASTFYGDLKGDKVEVDLSGASDFVGSLQASTKVEMELSGASTFNGAIQGSEVSIDLAGASVITGSIDADYIELEASGSSTVKATGSCLDYLDLDLSGSSDLLAPQMECRNVKGEMSGSSDAEFQVCESLQVTLSGSSSIIYGIPAGCRPLVNCPTSGSSSVTLR